MAMEWRTRPVTSMAPQLHCIAAKGSRMDALVIAATLAGSFVGALALQKAALEGLFRMMDAGRRARD